MGLVVEATLALDKKINDVYHQAFELSTFKQVQEKTIELSKRKDLLALESELSPVDVMFLYQIIDWVGDLADLAERVGARLEILLAR